MSGGGGGSDSTVLAVEERMTSHIKDMKYKITYMNTHCVHIFMHWLQCVSMDTSAIFLAGHY